MNTKLRQLLAGNYPGSIILLSIQWMGVKVVRDKLLINTEHRIIFAELVNNWEHYIKHYISNVTIMTTLLKSQFVGDDQRSVLGRGILKTKDVFNELQLLLKHQIRIMLEEPIFTEIYRHHVREMKELDKLLQWVEKGRKLKKDSQITRHMNKSWEFSTALLDMTNYVQFLMSFLEGEEYNIIIDTKKSMLKLLALKSDILIFMELILQLKKNY